MILGSIGNPSKLDSLEKVLLNEVKQDFVLEDTYLYNLSKARFLSGQLDVAFDYANKGIELCESQKNVFRTAKFHNLRASVFAYQKDNEKAIEAFKTSLAILEEAGDKYTAAQIQNNIANIFFGLSDYESAYQYSTLAYDELSKVQDTVHLPGVTGVVAVSALKLGKIDESIERANESLAASTRYKNPIGLIVSNYSLGEVHNTDAEYETAVNYYQESLSLSEMYRQGHFVMLNKIGLQAAYLKGKEFQKSADVGEQALVETTQLKNENTLYAIHKHLGYAYEGLGRTDKSFSHLAKAHNLYIESASIEKQKSISDILIKYDTEKKEKDLVISQLENVENQNQLYRRNQWIIILGTALILLALSYYFYGRLQRQRIDRLQKEQESKRMKAAVLAEEKERERISNELHDGMASTITGLKMKLEDLSTEQENSALGPLVSQMQSLHDETRRMSHNLMPLGLNRENWTERLGEYCRENTSRKFKIQFSNNLREVVALDPTVSILLYRSVQELIHNAQKHAKSESCFVQVSLLDQDLVISVEDEGVGFDKELSKGQGLESMRQRLDQIGASMEIDTKVGKGSLLSIYLSAA